MNGPRISRPPIVILTALEVEYAAVRATLADLRQPPPVSGTRFEVGSLGGGAGEVVLALTGAGNHGSAVIAERAIREFTPAAVLFVGVAGRLHPGLALGDVVVATHVYAYHGAAARTGGLKSRPRVWEIDHGIDQAARQIARRVDRARDLRVGAEGPRVHFGPVASGEILHDAKVSQPLRWLREHYDDALAIEMEAAGVAKAGHLSAAPVAVVRAISDFADGTKSGTDGAQWQARAVRNAATFATALAADLIAHHPARAGQDRYRPEVQVSTKGGSHGAVAGVINGGVHNDQRTGPAWREEGGWS
ncbi:5'-methylthioadenosine/S-adenosylhomocysteine nucleosidase [Actinoplanes sp. NPDC048967]|uniref:5'-methylthioadenosine/S-adenosylhomocysteine nucleosidase family protein n=1 Tax=Actinoplanes sp. NPDC048967 TaxID=3155269 RepID=UPI0034015B74